MSDWFFPRSASRFFMGLDRKPPWVDDQLDWVRVSTAPLGARAMHRGIGDPAQGYSLNYPKEMVLQMEEQLDQAEALAKGEKVRKRLELVRMEFEYLEQAVRVLMLYNAYRIRPRQVEVERLLNGIDNWNAMLYNHYDAGGKMKDIAGWPEIRPFRDRNRSSLGLVTSRRWDDLPVERNPFAWNTKEIRSRGLK